jgi:hypothetical protein
MFARGDSLLAKDVLPPGVLPCVWMSAGVVSFKLCDREGECEGCPFDRAMMGPAPPRHAALARRSPSLRAGRRCQG